LVSSPPTRVHPLRGRRVLLERTWGWPSITAADLPSGGTAYPLATPGVRVRSRQRQFQLLVGVYNGDPAPPCGSDDPQVCNSNGLDFELDDPPLLMVEGAYKYNQNGSRARQARRLEPFRRFRAPALLCRRQSHRRDRTSEALDNDWGFYGIIDQLIWRLPGSEDAKGVALFGRVIGAPSDRNLIDFYADGGVTFSGMIRSRPDDASPLASPIPAFPIRSTAMTSTQGLRGAQLRSAA
jgi:porin